MTATTSAPAHTWLTLGEASRLLGVDVSTLRGWADAGRIRAFRTPGGHRRFARADLQDLLRRASGPRPPQVARLIERQGRTLALVRSPADEPWLGALGGTDRDRIRRTCRTLMRALVGYLSGGVRRRNHLVTGERAGRRLGSMLAARRLTPAQATRAFLHFRGVMAEAVTRRLRLPPEDQVRSLRQMDAFLNGVLVEMLDVFERRPPQS